MRFIFALAALLSVTLIAAAALSPLSDSTPALKNYFTSIATITTVLTHCLIFFDLLGRMPQLKELLTQSESGQKNYEDFKQQRRRMFKMAVPAILVLVLSLVFVKNLTDDGLWGLVVFEISAVTGLVLNGSAFLRELDLLKMCLGFKKSNTREQAPEYDPE